MPRWKRQILFGDIDAMYASSAIVDDPSLAGQLVAVGSPPPRGIITSASYAARRYGVRSAMPTGQALRLCPNLVLVHPDHALYQRMHNRLRTVTDRLFPHAVWCSIDEFYADTTDLQSLHPDPASMAATVKQAIAEETGLHCTVAVATGRIVAKVATDQHKPDGLAVIPPGSEPDFLAPLPIRSLPGIGPKTGATLEAAGLRRIGDLLDPRWSRTLTHLWGRRFPAIQATARGLDGESTTRDHEQKSISHETTFDHDTEDATIFEATLYGFLTLLTHDLRSQNLAAARFTVKLKDARFQIVTRQRHFPKPLNYDPAMWPAIRGALASLVVRRTRYRLIGLTLSDLVPAPESLFDQRTDQAMAAMDRIIERHGSHVIRIGGLPGGGREP
jgi:DNA polymerase-4